MPQPTGSGVTLYVSKDGNDSSTSCSAGAHCLTIQRASNLATIPGSVVLVSDGEYTGFCSMHDGVTFFANGDQVRVTSELDGADCNQRGRVGINVEENDDVVVAGFTVIGMQYSGIRAVTGRGIVIRNNRVESNGQSGRASGILTGFAMEVQVLYNETLDNTEHGIYVSNSDSPDDRPVIRGNVTHGNTASGIQINGDCGTESASGTDGAVDDAIVDANYVYENGSKSLSMISAPRVTISNNVIVNNHQLGTGAGGIHLTREPGCDDVDGYPATVDAVIVNNTIVEPAMAAIRATDGATGATIFNNILVSSNTVALEDVTASISSTNVRVASTSGLFATGYELASTSPARDAGEASYQGKSAPGMDFAGETRPKGTKIDVGAYESF